MFVVRPVQTADIPAFDALVSGFTPGVHTLPRGRASMKRAVECSVASFAAEPSRPSDESYLFVLESVADGALLGTAAIAATAGAHGTFFAFRKDVLNQVSRDLGISHDVQALSLCSDLTGQTQLSGFFLSHPSYPLAALLSRARLMYAALAPQRFAERFFASMPGVADADGKSPFWEALGRKFFQMDFPAAERLVEGARNRSFIVELMPHYPVYVPLLPAAAQQAMSRVHQDGRRASDILREEGFETESYIDVFDGGAILQAPRKALAAFSQALTVQVGLDRGGDERGACLLASAREGGFRAVMADCACGDLPETVGLNEAALRELRLVPGDDVLCLRL